MEQKNLKFLLKSCVWVVFNSWRNFEHWIAAFNRMLNMMSTLKWKKLMEEGIRLFPCSFNVCACTDLFKAMACAMQHMHAYEECSWTCWIGSVLLDLKCRGGARHLWDGLSALWELTLVRLYLHWMPLNPDMFVLHGWQTWRWKFSAWLRDDPFVGFCTLWHWAELTSPPVPCPLSSLHWWAFCLLMHPALCFLFSLLLPFFWLLVETSFTVVSAAPLSQKQDFGIKQLYLKRLY